MAKQEHKDPEAALMPKREEHHLEACEYFQELQDRICTELESIDEIGRFGSDFWSREGGGGGRTRILTNGGVFEKAGVNFSDVRGQLTPEFASQIPGEGREFTATGISIVVHPQSPLVPSVHANFRYLTKGSKHWFGGGSDLTPYYPYREDVVHFHRTWKEVCQRHTPLVDYQRLKKWCDNYFFLAHRNEPRGVGGIFFDYLEGDWEKVFAFVRDCGASFLAAYGPIVQRRKLESYTDQQRAFQEFRRGRYVEFNLLYDRGTVFGLKTGGRVESILMSLPPVVRWEYNFHPAPGSHEAELYDYYLKPRDWANEK
jgi:coproporphyrinogen III oxidase